MLGGRMIMEKLRGRPKALNNVAKIVLKKDR